MLQTGLAFVRRISLALIPCLLLLAPGMAWLLGDWRTLPAILTSAPAVLLLGLCAVYSGWFCGRGDIRTPALNECAEQTVRCLLCAALLFSLAGRNVALTAALPGLAEIAAGVAVWGLFRRSAPKLPRRPADRDLRQQLLRLTAPTAASRLCQTTLRTLNAVLLPVCLRRSGLTQAAATAQFGLLNGMALPLLMLPGVVTGAICTVASPAVTRLEHHPARLKRTMRQLLLSSAGVGGTAMVLLATTADFISTRLYSEPALAPLLRLMCPQALLMALQQAQFGMITGLGLQRRALTATVVTSFLSLLITAVLCPLPGVRLYGAAVAALISSLLRTLWNQALLLRAIPGKCTESPLPCNIRTEFS